MNLYTVRKYNGDDAYSWAVFRKVDIPKGHRGVVFLGQASPIYTGCTLAERLFNLRVF